MRSRIAEGARCYICDTDKRVAYCQTRHQSMTFCIRCYWSHIPPEVCQPVAAPLPKTIVEGVSYEHVGEAAGWGGY